MPRGKRRNNLVGDEDRQPPKRLRSVFTVPANSAAAPQLPAITNHSSRRSARSDDSFSQRKCIAWFHQYTNYEDPETLGPDGMEKFCADVGVDPENIVMLVLAYKMGATQMGFFSQQEWVRGLTELGCDSVVKLRMKLQYLESALEDTLLFKSIYRYAYDFAKESDQRSMDTATAKAMLKLLLEKKWPLYTNFAEFLDQSKYKVINKDQWCNILEFSKSIRDDLENYDIDGAWPVMLDEFVEWLRRRRLANASQDSAISTTTIS